MVHPEQRPLCRRKASVVSAVSAEAGGRQLWAPGVGAAAKAGAAAAPRGSAGATGRVQLAH